VFGEQHCEALVRPYQAPIAYPIAASKQRALQTLLNVSDLAVVLKIPRLLRDGGGSLVGSFMGSAAGGAAQLALIALWRPDRLREPLEQYGLPRHPSTNLLLLSVCQRGTAWTAKPADRCTALKAVCAWPQLHWPWHVRSLWVSSTTRSIAPRRYPAVLQRRTRFSLTIALSTAKCMNDVLQEYIVRSEFHDAELWQQLQHRLRLGCCSYISSSE
jgi:hypothetical protein